MTDKVQKHDSFSTNTPSSESYKNNCKHCFSSGMLQWKHWNREWHCMLYSEFFLHF